jgi:Bacterial Ig-like domain (group 3)/FG-GAP-like repeat/FG-GAP repeat
MRTSTGNKYVSRAMHSCLLVLGLVVFAAPNLQAQTIRPRKPAADAERSLGTTNSDKANLQQRNAPASSPLFLLAVTYSSNGPEAGFVTVADVNGDGKPDLLVANSYYVDTIGVLMGKGDGTFGPVGTYASGGDEPIDIAVVDLNGDGKPDLIVVNHSPCYGCPGNGRVAVLLGNGGGSFQPAVSYDSGGFFSGGGGFGVADVNGDGKLDVIVASCAPSGSTDCGDADGVIGVLFGNGDGTFRPVVTFDSGTSPGGTAVAVADLNRDGKLDLIVTTGCTYSLTCPKGSVGVLMGNGDGTFRPSVNYALAGWSDFGIDVVDLNRDGKLDVVVGGCGSTNCWGPNGLASVLLGNGDGTFQAASGFDSGGRLADGIAVADVNGDGKLDILASDTIDGSVGMLPGQGDGTFLAPLAFATGGYLSYAIAVADLNGDGRPDVVTSGVNGAGIVSVLINTGSFTYSRTSTALTTSANPVGPKQGVTYAATVTSQPDAVAPGSVRFQDGDSPITSVNLTNNQATYSTSYKDVGEHPITVTYSGDPEHSSSTSAIVTEYVRGASKTELSTSGSPSLVEQLVTFTASVASKYGTIPDGDLITFYDGKTALASVVLANETATYSTSSLSAKSHSIRAAYFGDAIFNPSAKTVTQVVEKYTTTTTLASTPNPSNFRQAVTFVAHVTSAGPSATGKVRFLDGTTAIGTATVSGGVAQITKSNLAIGTHAMTAEYLGDAASDASTSSVVDQVVQ